MKHLFCFNCGELLDEDHIKIINWEDCGPETFCCYCKSGPVSEASDQDILDHYEYVAHTQPEWLDEIKERVKLEYGDD